MIVMDLETTGLVMPDAVDIKQQPYIIEFGVCLTIGCNI